MGGPPEAKLVTTRYTDEPMAIELRHLRAFVAIAEELSFTRAAERLKLTQPALSRTIAQFERLIHAKLVSRTPHSIQLTPTGTRLLPYARRTLLAAHDMVELAQEETIIRIGFTWATAGDYAAQVLQAFQTASPKFRVELHCHEDLLDALSDGRCHLAFLRHRPPHPKIAAVLLFQEPQMAAMRIDHPLASRDTLQLSDLRDDALIAADPSDSTILGELDREMTPRGVVQVRNFDEWLGAVALGRGVGLTARSTGRLHPHPSIRYVQLIDARFIPVFLAWDLVHPHLACQRFVATARDFFLGNGATDSSHRGRTALAVN